MNTSLSGDNSNMDQTRNILELNYIDVQIYIYTMENIETSTEVSLNLKCQNLLIKGL